jgi:hypothetical protein
MTKQSSIHVSLASVDAEPQATAAPLSHDIPISILPADQDAISELGFPLKVPQAVIPLGDPMVQLLQGFQTMLAKQDQDRHEDLLARQRFEANIQGMMTSRSQQFVSDSRSIPLAPDVPIGQYYPAPVPEA